jgi:hypothetical protein
MPCAPARNAPGSRSLLHSVGTRLGDATVFSFSCRFLCFAAHSPCPPLLACAVAAGLANARPRLRAALDFWRFWAELLRRCSLVIQSLLALVRFRALRLRMPSRHRSHHSGGRPCPPCLRPPVLSVLPMATSFPLPTEERILLRHCGGFLPPLFSSNRLDNTTHQRASNILHWNVHSGSAGLRPYNFGHVACPAVKMPVLL